MMIANHIHCVHVQHVFNMYGLYMQRCHIMCHHSISHRMISLHVISFYKRSHNIIRYKYSYTFSTCVCTHICLSYTVDHMISYLVILFATAGMIAGENKWLVKYQEMVLQILGATRSLSSYISSKNNPRPLQEQKNAIPRC